MLLQTQRLQTLTVGGLPQGVSDGDHDRVGGLAQRVKASGLVCHPGKPHREVVLVAGRWAIADGRLRHRLEHLNGGLEDSRPPRTHRRRIGRFGLPEHLPRLPLSLADQLSNAQVRHSACGSH